MNGDFTKYLKSVGMGEKFIERVAYLHEQCVSLAPNREVEDIFVSEQVIEKERNYLALHFFTQVSVFKLDRFIERFVLDMEHLGGVSRCVVSMSDFDLRTGQVSPDSRLHASPTWEPVPFSLQLVASGENCSHLLTILKKHIFPRILGIQHERET